MSIDHRHCFEMRYVALQSTEGPIRTNGPFQRDVTLYGTELEIAR